MAETSPRQDERSQGPGRYAFVPGTSPDMVVVAGEGSYLHLADGRRILDAAGGAIVTNVGHGRAEVAAAMAKTLEQVDYVIPPWATETRLRLHDRVVDRWLPEGLTQAMFVSGGSESTDSAMRLARLHHWAAGRPQRWKIIGRSPSYHGASLATLAVADHAQRRDGFDRLLLDLPKVPWDDADALAKVIEQEDPDTVAAVIAEPVIGAAGGCLESPPDWWTSVREICDRHGILLIADEVMTGFGRLGTNFGVEQWGVTPDVITAGKGLAGGYAPLGGLFASEAVVAPLAAVGQPLMFFTFSAHDGAMAAAEVVLDILEREELVARAATMGAVLRRRLVEELADHPHVSDIRGRGLMLGVELVAERDPYTPFPAAAGVARAVTGAGLERGVWYYPAGTGHPVQDAVMLGPPFTISDDEIEIAVGTLVEAIDAGIAAVAGLPGRS
jgi:adenosylmethionine-8-amino-7-oxononanoate aminotransferase